MLQHFAEIIIAAAILDALVISVLLLLGHFNWRNWRRIKSSDHTNTKTWSNHIQGSEVHTVPDNDLWSHEWEECGCSPQTAPVPREDGSMGWRVIHNAMDGRTN